MRNFITLVFSFLFSTNLILASDMTFAQIDGALISTNDANSVKRLESTVNKINQQKNIEFVIFTGNNISKPSKDNLEKFIEIANNLKCPYYVTIGNKDINKQKKWGKSEYTYLLQKKIKTHKKITTTNYIFSKNGVIFIVADGAKEFITTPSGYYKPETLTWLDSQLKKYKNKNVIILQHFPIIPPAKKETHYTHKADEYLELISKHDNVKAIISGHFGVNSEQEYQDIWHITTKSLPTYRVIDILDYETENPVFWSTIKE